MLKKVLLLAALALPSAAFAGHEDFVIRFDMPRTVTHSYDRHHYGHDYGYSEARMARWVNEEQSRQRARLEQGVRSGELTRSEATRLFNEQEDIRARERRYLADHHLSRGEFEKLQEELRESSRNISRQKSDADDRSPRYHQYGYNRW